MRHYYLIVLFLLSVHFGFALPATPIFGPSTASVGELITLTYDDGTVYPTWAWTVGGGTIVSDTRSGTIYTLKVQWNTSGAKSVTYRDNAGTLLGTKTITVSTPSCTPANPTPTFSIDNSNCGSSTLIVNGTVPAYTRWYLQTSTAGIDKTTDITPGEALTFSVVGTRTYYVRAKSTTKECWSTSSSSGATTSVYPPLTAPLAPTTQGGPCDMVQVLQNGTVSSGTCYWQGTDPTAKLTTNPSLNTPYPATASNTYYIRAKHNSLACWSASTGKYVFVDKPAPPSANSYTLCEFDPMSFTTTANAGLTIRWYNTSDQLLYTGSTYNPNLSAGDFTFRVKSLSANNCESTNYSNVTVSVQANCDQYLNWTESTAYVLDGSGNPVEASATKEYSDGLGGLLQSQSKSYVSAQVFASQPVKDSYNTSVVSTLPAPINSSSFVYRHKFIANNQNQAYSSNDFENSQQNNPLPVQNSQIGTLGWYYSSNNTLEPATPTTNFPYSRMYVPAGPNPTITTIAGAGDQFRMGSGHETTIEKTKITSELSVYYSVKSYFVPAPNSQVIPANPGYKIISTGADGKKAVSFVDADGREVASATLTGTSTYDNWSYSFYNDLGQLVATIAPNGANPVNTTQPQFVTRYKYDHLGQLIEVQSPDDGITRYVYSDDGKLRFSENQLQRDAVAPKFKSFSYTNYDYLGGVIESGEYTCSGSSPYVFEPHTTATPSANSILQIVNNVGFTGTSKLNTDVNHANRCSDYTLVTYDVASTNGFSGVTQANLLGEISRTENANAITLYSYDEFGRLVTTWQKIVDMSNAIKKIDYTYDYQNNVIQVAYQAGQTGEAFYHHYVYDADQRLTEVSTSLDGIIKTVQAKYYYYLHGPLKRVELGTNKQGIDYVYNLDGSLKLINHADPALDPGGDGKPGQPTAFLPDVFGEALDYYANDYIGANGNNESNLGIAGYSNQYGGLVKDIRWHNHVDGHTPRAYAYNYDNVNQLKDANFGNVTGSNRTYSFGQLTAYKENIGLYDRNGNIQTLTRNGKLENSTLANYGYNYMANTNKLSSVTNNSSAMLSYSYDAIGEMTQQAEGSNTLKVSYNVSGLVKEIKNGSDILVETFVYDDLDNRIVKKQYTGSGALAKSTFYVYDASGNVLAVYEQPSGGAVTQIELPIYGLNRVGEYKPHAVPNPMTLYEVPDHLGNVRGVIGVAAERTSVATIENTLPLTPDRRGIELNDFRNIAATEKSGDIYMNHTPAGGPLLPTGYTPNYSSYVKWKSGMSGQTANEKSVGPAIMLSVEPGDQVAMTSWAKWKKKSSYSRSGITAAMASILAASFAGSSPDMPEVVQQVFQNGLTAATSTALDGSGHPIGNGNDLNNAPAAYLYYLCYDKNLNFITAGWKRVTTASGYDEGMQAFSTHEQLTIPTFTVTEPGYMYIFVSNESEDTEVWFDDLTVTHTKSPIVAGADYYPFGLPMQNREITREDYRYGYQGQFSEEDKTTGWNEFELRMYDARIGRWATGDPYGQFASPYLAMGNTPNIGIDPDGGWNWGTAAIGFGVGAAAGYAGSDGDWRWTLAGGIAGGLIGGASFTKSDFSFAYSSGVGTHLAPGKLHLTAFGRNAASHAPQTWYYLWKHESDDGDPRNLKYPGHSMIFNPRSKKIYEINHANQDAKDPDGLHLWLDMNPKTYKSIHYVWNSDSEDGDYGKDDFWNYRGGRHHVELYPVLVPNPKKAIRFFESKNHLKWRYNLLFRNCKHYAVKGLRKGGSRIRRNGILPGVWKNSKRAGSWNNLDDVGTLP